MEESKPIKQQSEERKEIYLKYFTRINELKEIRKQSFPIIRDRQLTDYWDDSVKRFIQFKQRPSHKELWQANTASTTPADKLIGILSKLAAQSMESQVFSINETSWLSYWKERILTSLLKAAGKKNNDDKQLILEMLSAMVKGTVIGFEGWYRGKREIREITDQNTTTGEVKFKKKTIYDWNDVLSSLIPVENFYPGNVFVRPGEIQDMDDCAMRRIMTKEAFDLEFGGYEDVDKVVVKNQVDTEQFAFYHLDSIIGNNDVEVWYYFNKAKDEFVIEANNVWINPIGNEVSPLWWNHKKLPFWAGVFEPFAEDFFYGRSLPDKIATLGDMNDAMFDRILDQLAISIHKPIVTTKSATSITKGFLSPNNVIQVKGANLTSDFKTLDISEPSPVHLQMLQIISNRMDQATIANETIGKSSTGNPKTATEIMQVRESALELVSLFLKFMEFAIRDKNRLRLANILQFYTLPIHKTDKEAKFRKIILKNENIQGQVGKVEILFTDQDISLMQAQIEQEAKNIPEFTAKFAIAPDFIRNFEGDIEIVPTSSVKQTKSTRQVMEMNFQRMAMELFPDMLNREASFEDMARVFDKDINRIKAKPQPKQGIPGMPEKPEAMGTEGITQGGNRGIPDLATMMSRPEQGVMKEVGV